MVQLPLRRAFLSFDAKTPKLGLLPRLLQLDQAGGRSRVQGVLCKREGKVKEARSLERWSQAPYPTLTLFLVRAEF